MKPSYVLKDIEGYEERVLFGLTMRQAVWGTIALVCGVSFYFITSSLMHLPQDICIYGTIILSFSFFALGWAKWQETRPFSDYIKAYLRFHRMKQTVIYSNDIYYFKKKEGSNVSIRKTKTDKRINKKCTEYRK